MKHSEEYVIEDLLRESKKTLENLGSFDQILGRNDDLPDNEVSRASKDRFKEEESEGQIFKIDGYAEIVISDNLMSVKADFYPPDEGMKPLSIEKVMSKISDSGIVFGLDLQKLEDAVFECNTGGKPVLNVLIAQGKNPRDEIPSYYQIEEHLELSRRQTGEKKASIDYKCVSPFILVKEGEILAKKVKKQEGVSGSNILGENIDFSVTKVNDIIPGSNTIEYKDHIAAACEGRFEQKNNEFYVNEVLQIKDDVNYNTGHIDFPGDVIIGGHIQDGFKINSKGSIFTMKTLDASEITCAADLNVKQGIIGRKEAQVKVGGVIRAKFIENCYVEAGDNIYLEVGTMNSAVYTSGKIELGQKGVIVGGTVNAQNGVRAAQIGSRMGPRTEIYCGTDYLISNKLEWIRDNNIQLATKLNKVNQEITKRNLKSGELLEVRDKLRDTMHKLNESAASLVYKLDKNDNAEVLVTGKIYPGVYIEICHISYIVSREMSGMRFKLDKSAGVISLSVLR